MDGVIVVNKPKDFTSFDVVAKMRKILQTKKIGHAGTLDPQATGVLPVFVGEATKLCDFLPYEEKTYEAEMTLGFETDTEDIWGQVISEKEVSCTEEELRASILSFQGGYMQTPPMYSAKKVNGKKLYEYARAGITIEREPVAVEIPEIEITDISLPKASFTVSCSKGTYIRTLCTDIAGKIGEKAVMSALNRTRHGHFTINQAHTFSEIEERMNNGTIREIMISIADLFDYPEFFCDEESEKRLLNGNRIPLKNLFSKDKNVNPDVLKNETIKIYDRAMHFKALYRYEEESGMMKPYRMFLHSGE